MIKIDLLLLLFLVEFLLVFFGLTILFFNKYRKYRKNEALLVTAKEAFKKSLEVKIGEMENDKVSEGESKDEEDLEAKIARQTNASRLDFLKISLDSLKENNGDLKILWEALYNYFDEALKEHLQSYKDMLETLQAKSNTSNSEIEESLTILLSKAKKTEELEKIIEDLEKSNKEFETCVDEFEKKNEKLSQQAKELEVEVEMLSRIPEGTVKKEDVDGRIKGLESELDEKTKTLENLKKNYEALEQEYIALYRGSKPSSARAEI